MPFRCVVIHAFIRHIGSKPRSVISPHPIHACPRGCLSVLFLVSLCFFLKSFFHLFLIPAMVPDENSMEDPLCNSSFGTMVSLGPCPHPTQRLHRFSSWTRLHARRFGVWCRWPDSGENPWRFHSAVLGQGVHARRCGGPDVQETVEFHRCQERDMAEFPGVLLPASRHLYISRQIAAWLD